MADCRRMNGGIRLNLRIKGGRSCFYQWDSGQAVVVEHEGTIHEVHFAHKGDKNALTVIPKEIENCVEAKVPSILLQSAETLFAYLVFRDADGTETRRSASFPVIPRPKPDGYVYTETEVLNYNSLDERISQIEENGVSDEKIAEAVEDYLKDNPITGGGLSITDDGNGNVTVESTGSVTITDDGEGNVTIA